MSFSPRSGRRWVAHGRAGALSPASPWVSESATSFLVWVWRNVSQVFHVLTPTRGENLDKYGLLTQGVAAGGTHRHLAFGSCYSAAMPWAFLPWPFRPFS
jgi:hypothetical protein